MPRFVAERADKARDLEEFVDVLADWFLEVHPRVADLFALIRRAAAVDREVAALERARADQRLTNYVLAAAQVRERGGLTSLADEEAAATIWSLGHPDTYRALVIEREWSPAAYRS